MKKQYYKVGVVGATGMVGQRFVTLLEHHPWFKLTVLAASSRSAGKTYAEAVGSRWAMPTPMPESVRDMVVQDAAQVEQIAAQVDFIFCAVNMPKSEIKALEEAYAKAECPVVSNNSANRGTPDVPMVVPEINADHIEIIPAQRRRLGTRRGFIAVKSNCSLQSYVPAFHPLMKDFKVTKALVCTYQAISGAGKTFDRMPEIVDNVIPYIGGEEEKSEQEPLKLWAASRATGSSTPRGRSSRPSASACLCPTGTPPPSLSALPKSPPESRSSTPGRISAAPRRSSACPAPPNSSSTILRRTTVPSPNSTATPSTAWPSASAACGRTPSSTISSPA